MRVLLRLVASLVALGSPGALAQAAGAPPPGAARASQPAGGSGACPAGLHCTPLRDPVLGMDAFLVAAPSGWHVQGRVVYGTPCNENPFPVFRASSPDGLTSLERLPRFDWRWGKYDPKSPQKGCLPLREEISPADFLRILCGMMGIEYVGEVPASAAQLENQKQFNAEADARSEEYARNHPRGYEAQHIEVALAKGRFQNGSFPMEALLQVTLHCHRFAFGGQRGFWSENCEATIRAVRARAGKLEETAKSLDKAGANLIPSWNQAYQTMAAQRDAQAAQQMNQMAMQQMQLQNQLANQSMALQQQQHEQFLAAQDARFAVHQQQMNVMAGAQASSVAQHTQNMAARDAIASDWVDTALGQKTVRDPGTGQLNKVSGMYDYTWVDQTGKTSFQTRDPNADPNGHLQGTWTLQQQVHGNGTSR
jgi:hypothetical protein